MILYNNTVWTCLLHVLLSCCACVNLFFPQWVQRRAEKLKESNDGNVMSFFHDRKMILRKHILYNEMICCSLSLFNILWVLTVSQLKAAI